VDGSGTIALIKSGAGTWNLTNSNGYTGGTSISGGVLQLNGTVSGTSSIILTGSDSTLSVGTGGTLTSVGNFTLQGSAATGGVFNQTDGVTNLTTTTANAIVIGGVNNTFGKLNISGGTFNAKGATTQLTYYGSVRGELNVSGSAQANFFGINMNASGSGNGTINLTGGTLNIGTGGITNTGNGTSTINLGAGTVGAFGGDWSSTLAMKLTDASTGVTINTADSVTAAARTITLSGALSDGTAVAGKLNKDGVGTLTLTGTNTYTGLTTISAGTLQIGNGSTTGSIASTSGVTNNATLAYNRSNALSVGYAISGSGVVNQIGAGTTTLTGTNSYTGATNVNVGKLAINGDNSLATGAVTVASGATLAGNGTVGGATTIQSGGIHGPGNSPGVQTFSSDLTYAAGSIFSWDLATAAVGSRGTNYDGVNVGGNLSIDSTVSTGSIFRVVLGTTGSESDAFWNTSHSWDVFHVTGTPTGAFANFNVVDSGFAPVTIGSPGSFTYNGATGSLDWSAVPEPTSALAGLLIAAGLLRRRRVA
jgi:fibronectin-binding autotransporter adhesin